jgi:hypothetical protein
MSETRRMEQVGEQQWGLHSHYYLHLGLWWVEESQNRIILATQEAGVDVVNAVVDAADLSGKFVAAAVGLPNDDPPD